MYVQLILFKEEYKIIKIFSIISWTIFIPTTSSNGFRYTWSKSKPNQFFPFHPYDSVDTRTIIFQLQYLEALCKQLYESTTPAERSEAEKALSDFSESSNCMEKCMLLLENGNVHVDFVFNLE